ncbi:MAG: putative lipid II flippase FtsW [Spirochaetaceae bacterium]|nr:putative lipid II flippase FtsW [Spirochaetaceae bacterium]
MDRRVIFAEKSFNSRGVDTGFVVSVILLLCLGLITLYASSVSYATRAFDDSFYFVKRQLISAGIGLFCLFIFSIIDLDFVRKVLPIIFIGTLVLCAMTFLPFIGVERNGARRWIKLPLLGTFQPSEVAKFSIILFLANFFDKKHDVLKESGFNIGQAVFGLFFTVLLVFLQDDFSTAFFIMIVGLSMFYIAGIKLGWFLGFCVFSLPIVILFIFTESYRVKRLIAFFNPEQYSHGVNYQINASQRAISNGGILGEGFGSGLKKVTGIPEAQADFIFAGWAEAMGFLGVIIFFCLIIYFAFRGYKIAFRCEDKFRSFAAFGIITSIVLQVLLNCGVVCGALPATGIPLPFFSSGGSSLIITLLMCGVVINISKYNNMELNNE